MAQWVIVMILLSGGVKQEYKNINMKFASEEQCKEHLPMALQSFMASTPGLLPNTRVLAACVEEGEKV